MATLSLSQISSHPLVGEEPKLVHEVVATLVDATMDDIAGVSPEALKSSLLGVLVLNATSVVAMAADVANPFR